MLRSCPPAFTTFLVAVLGGSFAPVEAAPVAGEVLPMRQPDASVIDVRIWGDEFYTLVESLDGYTLIRDEASGFICYARLSDDGSSLISMGVAVGQGDPRALGLTPHIRIPQWAVAAQARAAREDFANRRHSGPLAPPARRPGGGPRIGEYVGICLIVDFADDVGTISPGTVSDFCNQPNFTGYGNNGSVRDYFYDVSDGSLTYTNYVPPAYYRALHPKTYYTDPGVPYGVRARELMVEALTALENSGFDFSLYDANGDGIIDALNCFYAGYSESAWAKGLWPHSWTVNFCADGVCTDTYQMSDMQNGLKLRTFCHENGHMLCGFPDLYDYDYDSTGVGNYCLMAYGASNTNPCEPCAYLKYTAGWADPTVLTTPQTGLTIHSGLNQVYLAFHPQESNEFFILENRQQAGRDGALPDAGLAIWHVDTFGSNSNNQQTPEFHYLATLVQADGRWDLEHDVNYGDGTDLWAAPDYTACTPSTAPNTNWWSGISSGLRFTNISASAATMTFDYSAFSDCNNNGTADGQDIGGGTSRDCNGNGIPDECDIAAMTSTDCDADGIPDECEPDCNGNGVVDACEVGPAMGLVGTYYDNQDFTGLHFARLDSSVNFDWSTGAPAVGFGVDHFSVRWSGAVRTSGAAGNYIFYAWTDDGVRLWVDGTLLIDKWSDQMQTEWSGAIALQANHDYTLVMEYYEGVGGAGAVLMWEPPGESKNVISSPNLRPGLDADQNGILDVCQAALGDLNCDGVTDFGDLGPFVLALIDPGGYDAAYPSCHIGRADMDWNGEVNGADIQLFVDRLLGGT